MDNNQQNSNVPEQQPAGITPVTSNKKLNNKIIAIVVLAMLAGIVIFIALSRKPKVEPVITEPQLKTYSGQYDSEFEGYITKFNYSFSYPTDKFTIQQSGNTVTLTDNSENTATKIYFQSNDAIGAADAKSYWDIMKKCPDCKQLETQIAIKNANETLTFASSTGEEWLIFPTTQKDFVMVQIQKPDTSIQKILETLSVSSTVIKPKGDNNIESWKNYNNFEYGFEFKYPLNYAAATPPAASGYLFYLKHASLNASMSVAVNGLFSLDRIRENFAPTGLQDIPPKKVQAGQNTFYYYGAGGGGVFYPDSFYYNLNGKLLVISFDGVYENDKTPNTETKQLEMQILETFKFTTPANSWKTYRNEKYSFEIGYPKEWKVIGSTASAFTAATSDQCKDDNGSVDRLMEQYKGCQRFTVWAGDTSKANYSDDPNNFSQIKIGGVEGEKFIYNTPTQATVNDQIVYIPKAEISGQVFYKGVWYKFSLNFHQGDINYALSLFDDFIKSFSFTK